MKDRQIAAEAAIHDQTNLLPKRQLLIVFSALAVSLLICFIDQNGVGVALPTIGRDLNATSTVSWAGTSALIANTVFQVLYGRLSDIFGRKIIFLSALALLSISDLLCGLSVNSTMLYVFRGLAGVANGGITSLTMMIVSDTVSLKERGKYQGILGACVGAGNMIGPFVAAAFVERSTWRGLFWLVAPLAAVCAVICFIILPHNAPKAKFSEGAKKIDYWGILTGSSAIILILIPVSGGGSYFAWDSAMVIGMLTVGGVCAIAFFFVEYRVSVLPMMPLSMYKNPPVCVLLLQNVLFGIVYYSQLYYLPLFYENALQLSPIVAAALVLPIPFAQMTFSIASGQYISRRERYGEVIWAGFFLWTLGAALTCIFTRNTPIVAIVFILGCQGAGVGLVFQPTLVALQAHCTKAQRAVVISNRNFLRSTGGAVGLAISAVMLQTSLKNYLPAGFKYLASSTYSTPSFDGVSAAQKNAVLDAYAKASRAVFIMNVPFIALCLVGCILIKDRGLQRPEEVIAAQQQQQGEEALEKASKGGAVGDAVIVDERDDQVVEAADEKASQLDEEKELREGEDMDIIDEHTHS